MGKVIILIDGCTEGIIPTDQLEKFEYKQQIWASDVADYWSVIYHKGKHTDVYLSHCDLLKSFSCRWVWCFTSDDTVLTVLVCLLF